MDLVVPRVYRCFKCGDPLCYHDDILAKHCAQKSNGKRASLFSHAMNVQTGPQKYQRLITGNYRVSSVHCSGCGEYLGWKYFEATQTQYMHKVGKIVIVRKKLGFDHDH